MYDLRNNLSDTLRYDLDMIISASAFLETLHAVLQFVPLRVRGLASLPMPSFL